MRKKIVYTRSSYCRVCVCLESSTILSRVWCNIHGIHDTPLMFPIRRAEETASGLKAYNLSNVFLSMFSRCIQLQSVVKRFILKASLSRVSASTLGNGCLESESFKSVLCSTEKKKSGKCQLCESFW